jgi:predicted extracellular nuclease
MEGSSSNKAIEIANVTGNPVDLSIYAVKLAANGNTDWSTATYNFPATSLANSDVFVIGNSSLAVCTGVVDEDSNVTFFGGNDVLGLFKNDVLIDILGTLGDTANFAQNTTLVRNSNIGSPNTTYTPSEWTSFASDTCSDLGSHTTTVLSVEQNTFLSQIKIYPNPTNGVDLNISTNEDVSIEVFNILGKLVLTDEISTNKNKIDISTLNTGIYLIRLSSDDGSTTRKFIKK